MKQFFLVIIWMVVTSFLAGGQQGNVDSMLGIVHQSAIPETTRINTINALGIAYWKMGNDSLAMDYHRQAILRSKKNNHYWGEANARLQLARMELEHLDDVKGAHAHLDTALEIAKRHKHIWLEAMSYFRRAQIYSMGFYEYNDTMLTLFEKARMLFAEYGDKAMEGAVYTDLGTLEAGNGRYAAAIDYLQKARKLQEASGDKAALRATLPNLGVMYINLKMYPEALKVFAEAEATAVQLNDMRVLAFIDYQRGDIYRNQKHFDSSMASYKKAGELFKKAGSLNVYTNIMARIAALHLEMGQPDSALLINTLADSLYKAGVDISETFFHYSALNYARIYLKKKNYQKAIYYATMGRDTLLNTNILLPDELASYSKVLSEAYAAIGNYKEAYQNHIMHKAWSDSVLNDESNQQILTANLTYEFEKKQQASALSLEKAKQEKLILTRNFLLVILIISLLAAGYIWWNNNQLRKKNKLLEQKNAEIKKALNTGQILERKRLSAELHDNLNTQLAAIKWSLEAMNTNELNALNKTLHARLLKMTEDFYSDLRLISHLLLPVALENNDLLGALQKLVAKINETHRVHFSLNYTLDPLVLNENVTHQLYNITLELVNNILKHSGATKAEITIQEEPTGYFQLSVQDNGKGMKDNSLNGNGIGLTNINQRAASFGGKVKVDSKADNGCFISITAPLDKVVL